MIYHPFAAVAAARRDAGAGRGVLADGAVVLSGFRMRPMAARTRAQRRIRKANDFIGDGGPQGVEIIRAGKAGPKVDPDSGSGFPSFSA